MSLVPWPCHIWSLIPDLHLRCLCTFLSCTTSSASALPRYFVSVEIKSKIESNLTNGEQLSVLIKKWEVEKRFTCKGSCSFKDNNFKALFKRANYRESWRGVEWQSPLLSDISPQTSKQTFLISLVHWNLNKAHCIILNVISSTCRILKTVVQNELRMSKHSYHYKQTTVFQH